MSTAGATFVAAVAVIDARIARARELLRVTSGLHFADDRGWIDSVDQERLADATSESRQVEAELSDLLAELAQRWPQQRRAWILTLLDRLAVHPSSGAVISGRLRAELDGGPAMVTLLWAVGAARGLLGADGFRP